MTYTVLFVLSISFSSCAMMQRMPSNQLNKKFSRQVKLAHNQVVFKQLENKIIKINEKNYLVMKHCSYFWDPNARPDTNKYFGRTCAGGWATFKEHGHRLRSMCTRGIGGDPWGHSCLYHTMLEQYIEIPNRDLNAYEGRAVAYLKGWEEYTYQGKKYSGQKGKWNLRYSADDEKFISVNDEEVTPVWIDKTEWKYACTLTHLDMEGNRHVGNGVVDSFSLSSLKFYAVVGHNPVEIQVYDQFFFVKKNNALSAVECPPKSKLKVLTELSGQGDFTTIEKMEYKFKIYPVEIIQDIEKDMKPPKGSE